MVRLSLCMIARDEEQLLPGCLASVRGFVNEIVLVDTGSADRTREVARDAGAIVVEHAWRGDFAEARNVGLARATGDFVLVLDADERLAPGSGAAIRRALVRATFDTGFVRLHDASRLDATPEEVRSGAARLGEPSLPPRLFRRAGGLRYEGLVHETVPAWFERRSAFVDADVVHLGASPSVRDARRKRARDVGLLRDRAEGAPHDVTPLGYLALELYETGEHGEAQAVVDRGWATLERLTRRPTRQLAMARALLALGRGDAAEALESVERAEPRDRSHPDLRSLWASAAERQATGLPAASAERAALLARAVEVRTALASLDASRGAAAGGTFARGCSRQELDARR